MKGNCTFRKADIGCEAWITVNKNHFEEGETVEAILQWGHYMRPDVICDDGNIRVVLTDPSGMETEIAPTKGDGDYYRLSFQVIEAGSYTLTCIYESPYMRNEKGQYYVCTHENCPEIREVFDCLQISSICFLVGSCEVAVPKAPDTKMLFKPEKWEVPANYKLISLYLKCNGKPVKYSPVTLVFSNRDGFFEKALQTDGFGNVYFAPYIAGTYCLISKTVLNESIPDSYDCISITTTFSFTLNGSKKSRGRLKQQADWGSKI